MHILSSAKLDALILAERINRAAEDAIAIILHFALSDLKRKPPRILFSSAFITIPPQHLVEGMKLLGVQTGTYNWILKLLTQWHQAVRVGRQFPRTICGHRLFPRRRSEFQ